MCAERRLRLAWAYAQFDSESLPCPHEEDLGPQISIKRISKIDQTGQRPRLLESLGGRIGYCIGFVVLQFNVITV